MSASIAAHIKSSDWKTEKHVPVIDCPDEVAAGEVVSIGLSVGKEIAHPNTTEHHIRWIELYYKPDSGNFVFEVGRVEFNAHGESPAGANQGPVHAVSNAIVKASFKDNGTLHAVAYCNIHGLWEGSKLIRVS